jgi:putative membrane protein
MIVSSLFAFLHHGAAFMVFASLVVQRVLTRDELTLVTARRVLDADRIFGIAAGVLLVVGMLRVGFFEKGPAFYWHNAAFIAKLSLFVIVGLLSIYPTIEFLKWRKPLREGVLPVVAAEKLETIRRLIGMELGAVMLIIACAALMARGIGFFG